MTREEIIQGLQFTIDMFLTDSSTGEALKEPRNDMDKTTIDSCREAIEALKQQPCDDCISRQSAIEVAKQYWYKPDIAGALAELPPVQPKYNASEWCKDCSEYDQEKHCCQRWSKVIRNTVEEIKQPKTGHWKEVALYSDGKHKIECSECGSYIFDRGHANSFNVRQKYKYCPNCGAKMIELQESEG